MSTLYINKQTEAEKDQYLFECFHDSGIITELIESSYTIISGRKGAGKTAIARYLEKYADKYDIDFAYRVSIRNFNLLQGESEKDTLDSILSYVLVRTVQKMINTGLFKSGSLDYWKDFLQTNGLQQVSDYESFVTTKKNQKTGFSIRAIASYFVAKGEARSTKENEVTKERSLISDTPSSLYDSFRQSLSEKRTIVFIDDISDYLDESEEKSLKENINIIKALLLSLQTYNLSFIESNLNVRFVSLVRDDLFEFMEGSNISKLKSDSLQIAWTEKDFASLVLKRMPQFVGLKGAESPVQALKKWFPDEIFTTFLENFSTNRFGSNFYAYMAAISFNRPRDFLQFCYALRNRLSDQHPATTENIESAEIEYTEYFMQELRDELYIASRIFHYDFTQERINQLVDILSKNDSFNSSQLKAELGAFISQKTSIGNKKIELLLAELWRYGIIGVTEKKDRIIRFRYLSDTAVFTTEKIKSYVFYLHRGLWWFAKKRKKDDRSL